MQYSVRCNKCHNLNDIQAIDCQVCETHLIGEKLEIHYLSKEHTEPQAMLRVQHHPETDDYLSYIADFYWIQCVSIIDNFDDYNGWLSPKQITDVYDHLSKEYDASVQQIGIQYTKIFIKIINHERPMTREKGLLGLFFTVIMGGIWVFNDDLRRIVIENAEKHSKEIFTEMKTIFSDFSSSASSGALDPTDTAKIAFIYVEFQRRLSNFLISLK